MIQSDSDGEGSVSLQEVVSPASRGPEFEEQTTEIPSINIALAVTTQSPPVMNEMEHVAEEGKYRNCFGPSDTQIISFPLMLS